MLFVSMMHGQTNIKLSDHVYKKCEIQMDEAKDVKKLIYF